MGRRGLWVLILSLVVGGCGFHLRGKLDLPPEFLPVGVVSPPGSLVAPALRAQLTAAGVPQTAEVDAAGMVIRIFHEQDDRRVVAVNQAGKVVASELRLRVDYQVRTRDDRALVPRTRLDLAREQVNPEIEVLGKAEEAALMRRDLVADMADRILQQVRVRLR